ncbi:unnamed protein product [Adineta ricciae]|uniref:Uncharacterized protein n=1 Tax=Adineta ricciae TaxID=249248 RepID=A0A815U7C6_ADIRI|nr:unnamed protein product [Adineta ricciae]CAF1667013.1 unnamed protein product [Adineta ricciae]
MVSTKFELLPKGISLQSFHYLNIIDIFHSFDQLNSQFNILIRNIPFALSLQNVQNKFQCEQFLSQIQTLITLSASIPETISGGQWSSIVHLSIFGCGLDDLFVLFTNMPKLKYLRIENVSGDVTNATINSIGNNKSLVNNMKTLHIDCLNSSIDYLSQLLERAPNLENLILFSFHDPSIIDASRWKTSIVSSLRHLKNSKFKFNVNDFQQNNINEESLKEFQNSFWYNERRWYTEYFISNIFDVG